MDASLPGKPEVSKMQPNRTDVGVDTAKRLFQLHWVDPQTGETSRRTAATRPPPQLPAECGDSLPTSPTASKTPRAVTRYVPHHPDQALSGGTPHVRADRYPILEADAARQFRNADVGSSRSLNQGTIHVGTESCLTVAWNLLQKTKDAS